MSYTRAYVPTPPLALALQILVISAFLCICLLPALAHASGNVLLPADPNASSSSIPNLGIGGGTPTSPSPNSNQQSTSPPSNASNDAPTTPNMTPKPAPVETEYVTSPVSAEQAASLGTNVVPTHIIHMPDASVSMQTNKNLPHALAFSFSNKSVFGPSDVMNIHSKLGLSSSQIASACLLTIRGMLNTDKASYIVYNSAGTQPVMAYYDGTISSIILGANALCQADPNRLPPDAGYITLTAGRFIIPLQPIACAPPTRQASTATVYYNGTTQATCVYN